MSEDEKKSDLPYESYEDSAELGQTMMDIDLKKTHAMKMKKNDGDENTESGDDIDELLKKKRSLTSKLKGIFGKR